VLSNTCRRHPIAALAGRKRCTSWSGLRSRAVRTACIASRSASQPDRSGRTALSARSVSLTTTAITPSRWTRLWQSRNGRNFASAAVRRRSAQVAWDRARHYVELTMGYPREWSRVTVEPGGVVEVAVGTLSSGQATRRASLNASASGSRAVRADPACPGRHRHHSGRRWFSFRPVDADGGVCMGSAATSVVERSRRIAAHILNVAPEAVEFSKGGFRTVGGGRTIGIFEVARAAQELNDLDDSLRGPLSAESDTSFTDGAIPMAPRSAKSKLIRDRCRRDRKLLRDRRCGSGGQSDDPAWTNAWRHCPGCRPGAVGTSRRRSRHRAVMTGSFMDYAMPRADMLPSFKTRLMEIPSPTNPLPALRPRIFASRWTRRTSPASRHPYG